MALPRKPNPDGSLVLHRLELPPELANELGQIAAVNERSIPGQVRIALREWISSKATGTQG